MYIVPETQEIVLHPEAKRLVELPPEELRVRALEELEAQAKMAIPDLERVMGLGQVMRLNGGPHFAPELVRWLAAHPTTSALDAACLFVNGYWSSERRPTGAIVERLIQALADQASPLLSARAAGEPLSAPLGVTDSLVLALVAAHQNSDDETTRGSIRGALLALVPLAPYLQFASQSGFAVVTGVPLPPPPPAVRPEDYRAYSRHGATAEYYVIERRANRHEVLRVAPPVSKGLSLEITYEIREPKLTDPTARRLILHCLLRDLLKDAYGDKTALVYYTNQVTNSITSERFALGPDEVRAS